MEFSNASAILPVPAETTANEQEQFTRREEKFFLPNSLRERFLELVQENLPPFYPDESTKYTLIESVYFDSPQLKSFTDHFNKEVYRFKLRTRRYAPNGQWQSEDAPIFVELKTKQHDISDKFRMKLHPDDHIRLRSGEKLAMAAKRLSTAVKINSVIETAHPVPVCRVTYRRLAFQSGNLRLTVDDQLQGEILNRPATDPDSLKKQQWWPFAEEMNGSFKPDEVSLVEVKHCGTIPFWLTNFMRDNDLCFRSFSKYCNTILNYLGAR